MVASGEVDLDVVGIVFGAVGAGASAEGFETGGEQGAHAVGSELVVAGGFDFDEFTDGLDESVVTDGEILQAVVPVEGGVRGGFFCGHGLFFETRFDGFCRVCRPSRTHIGWSASQGLRAELSKGASWPKAQEL